jgi:hypothetical protein
MSVDIVNSGSMLLLSRLSTPDACQHGPWSVHQAQWQQGRGFVGMALLGQWSPEATR